MDPHHQLTLAVNPNTTSCFTTSMSVEEQKKQEDEKRKDALHAALHAIQIERERET